MAVLLKSQSNSQCMESSFSSKNRQFPAPFLALQEPLIKTNDWNSSELISSLVDLYWKAYIKKIRSRLQVNKIVVFFLQVDVIRSFSSDPELIEFTELFCHNTSSNEQVADFIRSFLVIYLFRFAVFILIPIG